MDHAGESLAEAQLYALIEVAAEAAGVDRLDDLLELAAERSRAALGAASVSISRWEGNTVRTLVNVGELASGEERFPTDECYSLTDFPAVAEVLSKGAVVIAAVDDPGSDPAQRELLAQLGKESSMSVPIVHRGSTWGELWAASGGGAPRFEPRDATFLRAIADQMSAAIGHAERFGQVQRLANSDPLTGLANRRAFEEALEAAFAAEGTPTVVLCDIDGLKQVNDTGGHAAGDELIIRVARALSAAADEHGAGLVARIGGDEFCVLLSSGGTGAGQALAEDAVGRMAASDPPAHMSCGVATRNADMTRAPELLRAADTAQYRAKRAGPRLAVALDKEGPASVPGPGLRTFRDGAGRRALAAELLTLLGEMGDAPAEDRLATLVEHLGRLVAEVRPLSLDPPIPAAPRGRSPSPSTIPGFQREPPCWCAGNRAWLGARPRGIHR